MKPDNVIIWLKILWALLGFLLFPLLYAFLAVFRTPYAIAAYIVIMAVAIYVIFIRETEEVAPVSLPRRSVLMTVINYRRGEKEEVGECVICLNYFQEEEEVARIGCCGSRFHVECIGRAHLVKTIEGFDKKALSSKPLDCSSRFPYLE
ncbi:hypothetical protein SUGI_0037550 [Cryptomeria japonica]|nr:hypothetical protein SUGI_0037550 [Cryptomeria japonica]